MLSRIKWIFIVVQFFSSAAWAQYTVSGQVFEKGRRIKLSQIKVFILPDKLSVTTDANGAFTLTGIQSAQSQLVINAAGFERYDRSFDFASSTEQSVVVYLGRDTLAADLEVDVIDSNKKRDPAKKSLSRRQIFEMPGANGDPVKAVQNLPGINRAQGFSSQVIVQGSAPKDTAYDFEGHEIPLVFHFGGLTSVVMPEAVESVDYFSAGYQSDLSRALGGIISLRARNPEVTERESKGLFYVDNLSAGGLYEARIDEKSSYLISGRYSYVGFFLKNALKNNDALDLTVAPEFMDVTGVYARRLGEGENLKLSVLGSQDRLAFVFEEPLRMNPSVRGSFSNTVRFYRFIPQYTKKFDENQSMKLSAGLGQDAINVDIGDRYFNIASTNLTTRAEYERKLATNQTLQVGWDNTYARSDVKFKIPVRQNSGGVDSPTAAQDDRVAEIKNAKLNNVGLYARHEHVFSEAFKLIPGLRYDRFSQTKENFLLPRLAAQYNIDEWRFFKWGLGQYVQNPEPQETSSQYGNPDIKSPRADHFSMGYDHDFRRGDRYGWNIGINTFYRRFSRVVISSSSFVERDGVQVPEVYNNDGRGQAYGLELSGKVTQENWSAMLAYTLSKSERTDPRQGTYLFEYDQTHNLNLIASYEWGANWKVSGRYRYVTGNPNTPIVGAIFDADNEVYYPQRGKIYSERNKDFQQLDLRFDKKFILDTEIWSFYFDIQNVLNIKNPEGYQYSYDYKQKIEVTGLPTVPAIGVRGEF
jgi:CarboxypepD_reg-like domain